MALWSQLESELRRRVEAGDFDLRFPTDRELVEVYGVSRHTARHAVARLGTEGIVRRARGVGTEVDRQSFERSLGSLYSLFQVVEQSGVAQHSQVRRLARITDAEAAARLGRPVSDELVVLERLRLAGGEPLAIDRVWLPADIAGGLLLADFEHTSLYGELDRLTGRRPNSGWERIAAGLPSVEERRLLKLGRREAVFNLQRLGCIDGDPIEWRATTIRGSRFTLVADWTTGQRNEIQLHVSGLPGGGRR